MPNLPDTRNSARKFPLRGLLFLTLLFVGILIVTTSLLIYALHTRLGYSYAVHEAIFFPISDNNQFVFLLSVLLTAGSTYFIYRRLARRKQRGVKLVPWWMQIMIVAAVALYVIEVLQIDISLTASEEHAKGVAPN